MSFNHHFFGALAMSKTHRHAGIGFHALRDYLTALFVSIIIQSRFSFLQIENRLKIYSCVEKIKLLQTIVPNIKSFSSFSLEFVAWEKKLPMRTSSIKNGDRRRLDCRLSSNTCVFK